ncbi:MAG: hypothetical protein IJZ12_02890 [Clostridia bacterium]|nr:hypothetical protein [Clostridia bacterium]
MQKDTPITNEPLSSESVLGQNMELLILHKAYLDLTEEDEKKEGSENADKN